MNFCLNSIIFRNQQSVHHRLPEIEIDDGIVRLDEMADEG